jgi:hypothetical protein
MKRIVAHIKITQDLRQQLRVINQKFQIETQLLEKARIHYIELRRGYTRRDDKTDEAFLDMREIDDRLLETERRRHKIKNMVSRIMNGEDAMFVLLTQDEGELDFKRNVD